MQTGKKFGNGNDDSMPTAHRWRDFHMSTCRKVATLKYPFVAISKGHPHA